PCIVASALRGVPGSGVASAVVQEVERRIVGVPPPGAPAALLPRLTWPALRPLAGLAIVGVGGIEVRGQADILVWAHAIGPPDLLAGVDVVGRDVAAHPELAAGDAGDIFVLDHQARSRDGLPLRRIGVLGLPDLLPRV